MKKDIKRALVVGYISLLWLTTPNWHSQASEPTKGKTSLPEVAKDVDEFYAVVDKVNSPTELTVTVLDEWNPMDKLNGPRWPEGKAKVKPAKRLVILEDTLGPNNAEQKKAALDFINKIVKESSNEVICTGSSVVTKKSGEICVTGYVFVRKGKDPRLFTINNALVLQGLATTTNPFYKSWQQEAKQKKLGIWRDQK